MARYVALLRGINVGGKNLIKMSDLKVCFERLGLRDVATYIASGNVLFTSSGGAADLVRRIEPALEKAFDYRACVVLRTDRQLGDVVGRAPRGFGKSPHTHRYDVIFLKEPLRSSTALESVPRRAGVDEAWAGKGVLYFSRLTVRAAQSKLSRVVSLPIYKSMTIRNWNTTTALLRMMEG